MCGDEFCDSCLLYPRGRKKPPTCKACALANSGLRGGGGGEGKKLSKREWKKRRQELEELLAERPADEPAVQFFELEEQSDRRPAAPRPAPIAEREAEPIHSSAGTAPATRPPSAPPPPDESPSTQPAPPPERESAPPPPPAPDPVTAETVDTSIDPLEPSAAPQPATAAPPAAPTSPAPNATRRAESAAELLARLKDEAPTTASTTQTAVPTSPVAAPGGSADPGALDLEIDPFATAPSPSHSAPVPTAGPALSAAAPDPPGPPGASAPWTPPEPPPRGTTLDEPTGPGPAHAPVGESSFADSPFGADHLDHLGAHDDHAHGNGGFTDGDDPSSGPVPAEPIPAPAMAGAPQPEQGALKADEDAGGNWIPPILRGMASAQDRAADDPLPRRRGQD